MFGG
jgi:catechol 2,3-dioxygenase-like lactoylglutathione lyase family enzyme